MVGEVGEVPTHSENPHFTFVKEGPKLDEVSQKPDERDNVISSSVYGPESGWKREWREFTEKEGLEDLGRFLATTIETAREVDNQEVLEKAKAFRENVVFVGEPELQEAITGIASRFVDLTESRKQVLIYVAGFRSERYITLRIMETFDELTEKREELQQNIRLAESSVEIAKKCQEQIENCVIVVPDDFVISGNQIESFASKPFQSLLKLGVSPEEAVSLIEAAVIAAPIKKGKEPEIVRGRISDEEEPIEKPLKISAYYGVREYKDEEGRPYVHTGVSLSGSHSSVDYGFENPLKDFQGFLQEEGEATTKPPLLVDIKRPYELVDDPSREYKNPGLQRRWKRIKKKYGL